MAHYWNWLCGGAAAYLLGSVPFGFLLARARGVDIRKVGSGNIGATNVSRCVSRPLGIVTFALDMAKGYAGCLLIPLLAARCVAPFGGDPQALLSPQVVCGLLTIVGHNWPLFLGFKGGKGIATSAGLLLALAPMGCLIALSIWIFAIQISRFVSLSSILAAVGLGVVAWPLYYLPRHQPLWFVIALDALAVVAVWRHRANIRRLIQGTAPAHPYNLLTFSNP
jgi:glycerol-3-phosphate acyltransferase PlsY